MLIRSAARCAWAIGADVSAALFARLDALARSEPPARELRAQPMYAEDYRALVEGRVEFGPAFTFPIGSSTDDQIAPIVSEALLATHFRGWIPGELAAGRAPVLGVIDGGRPVSICFCARRGRAAAEAGLETAQEFRGRGFGPRVTWAWAAAVRAQGLAPLYSTSWNNQASLAVARKLELIPYASDWSIAAED